MLIEPRCVRHVSLDRVCRPTLRFPPQGPPGRVPLLQRYYQSATTSCRHPAALRCLRLAVPRFHSLFRSPADECTAEAWSWSPGISSRDFAEETTGPPKFLGNLNCPFAHVPIRRRQDCLHQTITVQQRGPWSSKKAKAPTKGLSTLNSMAFGLAVYASQCGLPNPTQDSLPAAGQALPDGLSTRRIPMKGFKVVDYISFPFPKLCLFNFALKDCSRIFSDLQTAVPSILF